MNGHKLRARLWMLAKNLPQGGRLSMDIRRHSRGWRYTHEDHAASFWISEKFITAETPRPLLARFQAMCEKVANTPDWNVA